MVEASFPRQAYESPRRNSYDDEDYGVVKSYDVGLYRSLEQPDHPGTSYTRTRTRTILLWPPLMA